MTHNASKLEMLENLRTMLRDVFRLRSEGGAYAKLARAHGYIDGYMRLMMEAGIADKHELLAVVTEERGRVDGPATREVTTESPAPSAATLAA